MFISFDVRTHDQGACEKGSYLHEGRLYEAQVLRYANLSKIESFVVLAKWRVVIETQS